MSMESVQQKIDEMVNNIGNMITNMFDVLMKDNENIIGIGLGSKVVGDVQTGTPSMTYLVKDKVPLSQLAANDVIAPMKHGVVTDVLSVGEIQLLSSNFSKQNIIEVPSNKANSNSYNSYNSYNSGYSNRFSSYNSGYFPQAGDACKYYNSNIFGTIGCLVRDEYFMYLLSNNHVLNGMNIDPSNSPIFCSSKNANNQSNNPSGTLAKFADINFISSNYQIPPSNRIDAAIATLGNLRDLNNSVRSNSINGTAAAKIGGNVQKLGASTGLTDGKVLLRNAAIKVKYNNKDTIFTGQTVTTAMASHGDSGSLGVNPNGSAFGLLFAGSDKISIYNPIDEVLNQLNVRLL